MRREEDNAVSLCIALCLAFVGGFFDIYTYIARGRVFANTQTGNLVLLGMSLQQGNIKKVIYYVIAITSFMSGIVVAKIIEHVYVTNNEFVWLHVSVGIEMVVVMAVMWIPRGRFDMLANMLISFICAIQVQSFRKVNGRAYSTAVFTGNVKNASERLCHYILTKERKALEDGVLYVEIILSFITGALVGTYMTQAYQEMAVGITIVILGIVFLLLFYEGGKKEA